MLECSNAPNSERLVEARNSRKLKARGPAQHGMSMHGLEEAHLSPIDIRFVVLAEPAWA